MVGMGYPFPAPAQGRNTVPLAQSLYHPYPFVISTFTPPKRRIYVIGSLRNEKVPRVAEALRAEGYYVYDDWYAAGPEADDYWKKYSQERKHSYKEALQNWAATHTYQNDKQHLDDCNTGVLVLPAGKSCHLELGYMIGQGKEGYILLDQEKERWDVMYRFAKGVAYTLEELLTELRPADGTVQATINYAIGSTKDIG